MTNSERIKTAREIMKMAEIEDERKRESSEEIKKRHEWIDAAIIENPDEKVAEKAIKDCRKWYSEIEDFAKDKSKQAHRAKNLRQAFEDCVMGVGQFNAKQTDFSDIAENWINSRKQETEPIPPKKVEHVFKTRDDPSVEINGKKYTQYKCINCKVTAIMAQEGNEDIKRTAEFASSVFALCGQEEKGIASGGKKPAPLKGVDGGKKD